MHDMFFFTDIHGSRPLFDAIMNYCREQDPEATIIFGGDAMDRGSDGYTIMKELLDNPYVIYLIGNHEDMFCKAAREIKDELKFKQPLNHEEVSKLIYWCRGYDERYLAIQNVLYNGGLKTLTDWVMDGMPMNLVERIEKLPRTFSYEKCDFCHSAGVYRTFKEVADAEYEGKEPDEYAATTLIWGRTGLNIGWAPNRIAIFGHTPVECLPEFTAIVLDDDEKTAPVMYLSDTMPSMTGWKLDMDTGAIFHGITYVLNVLTMRAQGLKLNENGDVEKIECIQF